MQFEVAPRQRVARTANLGEWAEALSLLTVLTESQVAVDDGRRIARRAVAWVSRRETVGNGDFRTRRLEMTARDKIRVTVAGGTHQVLIPNLVGQVNALRAAVLHSSSRDAAFQCIEGDRLLNLLGFRSVKASSRDRADMTIGLTDGHEMACSVKSEGGGAPTILNASRSTYMRYPIMGLGYRTLPTGLKPRAAVQALKGMGGVSVLNGYAENDDFCYNLGPAGSVLPKLVLRSFAAEVRTPKRGQVSASRCLASDMNEAGVLDEERSAVNGLLTRLMAGLRPCDATETSDVMDAMPDYLLALGRDGDVTVRPLALLTERLPHITFIDSPSTTRYEEHGVVTGTPGQSRFLKLNFQLRLRADPEFPQGRLDI